MPEILYSDIEVTAKVVMDPRTMDTACNQISQLLDRACNDRREFSALERVRDEMRQVLSRLADMHVIWRDSVSSEEEETNEEEEEEDE